MRRVLLLFPVLGLLSACLRPLDPGELTRTAASPPAAAECSACHAYPLQDPNHRYHLVEMVLYVKKVNGPVTCLDCHRNSIRSETVILLDSIFRDSNGSVQSSLDQPSSVWVRNGTLVRVDTVVQRHPVPSGRSAPSDPELREWLTGLSHLNGRVDVDFDPAVSDTARFHGERAQYNPAMETCSAVSCHPRSGEYRFPACSKGLPALHGGSRPASACDAAP